MNTNYQKIKDYIASIKKYQIKTKEINEDNNEIDKLSINYIVLNEDINVINKDLIMVLLKDSLCKELFFDKIEDVYVFNQNKFIEVIFNTNEYMECSYTKYPNKIGMFVKDDDTIQLNFPYKDCILVGGMDKEDDKVNLEVFYNEILEKDKINKLFEPKVFHNIKKYSYVKELAKDNKLDNQENIQIDNKVEKIGFEIITDENGKEKQILKDNLLIKGNNLLGLHSLAKKMSGMIDVIYIDPPYYFNDTKASDSFAYNSNFKLSTWLTFMKNRLEIARELLSDTGVIFISMNEDGNSYLKLLCDDIFNVNNYIGNFMWLHGKGKKDKYIRTLHQNNLAYFKNKNNPKLKDWKEIIEKEYTFSNPDNDIKGDWFSGSISFSEERSNKKSENYFTIISPSGVEWTRQWQKSKKELENLIKNGDIYFGEAPEYKNVPREKIRPNTKNIVIPKNIIDNCGTTKTAENILIDLFGYLPFDYPKEVKLIKHLINLSSNKNSIILDFFAGSGTTGHATLSLNFDDGGNRKFILLEQMDYIETLTSERIKRCMIKDGYESDFIYMELKENKVKLLKNMIKSCTKKEDLITLINNNFDDGFFINIDNKNQLFSMIENILNKETLKLNLLNDCIKLIIEKYMDNNIDYISYEDIEELKNIKENEYILNKLFYKD